jgi:hypothetical protein
MDHLPGKTVILWENRFIVIPGSTFWSHLETSCAFRNPGLRKDNWLRSASTTDGKSQCNTHVPVDISVSSFTGKSYFFAQQNWLFHFGFFSPKTSQKFTACKLFVVVTSKRPAGRNNVRVAGVHREMSKISLWIIEGNFTIEGHIPVLTKGIGFEHLVARRIGLDFESAKRSGACSNFCHVEKDSSCVRVVPTPGPCVINTLRSQYEMKL